MVAAQWALGCGTLALWGGEGRRGAALGGGGRLAPLLQEVEEARVPPLERAQQPLGSEVAAHLGEGRGTAASEAQGGSLLWVAARSCSAELQPWVAAWGLQRGVAARRAAHVA